MERPTQVNFLYQSLIALEFRSIRHRYPWPRSCYIIHAIFLMPALPTALLGYGRSKPEPLKWNV
jgi:hypothetical protein